MIRLRKKYLELLIKKGIINIAFSGGESLLRSDLQELIIFTSSLKATSIQISNNKLTKEKITPNIFVISNGSLISNQFLDFCQEYKIRLSMSLPGISTYNEHTQFGTAKTILHWFEEAKKRNILTTVNITVTKRNFFELYETISLALISGADSLLLNRFLPGGRGIENSEELLLSIKEINEMLDIAEDILQKSNRFGSVGTELPKCILNRKDYKHLKVGTRCSAALDFFTIDPSGYIRACNHSENRLVHISEFEKLKNNSIWKQFVMKDYKPIMCNNCEYIYDCDGGCREAANICGGCINAKDPIFI